MVARRARPALRLAPGLALGCLALLGCEPSIAPSVLKTSQAEVAALQADLAKAEEKQKAESERVKALLKEVRAARELISGRESDAIESAHFEQVVLRRASAEIDVLLDNRDLLKTLNARKTRESEEALKAIEAIPPRPLKTLVDVHQAQAALLQVIPVLLKRAKTGGKESEHLAARHRAEIADLRVRLSRGEDQQLTLARDMDRALRRLKFARESLEGIAKTGDSASQAAAKKGLETSAKK